MTNPTQSSPGMAWLDYVNGVCTDICDAISSKFVADDSSSPAAVVVGPGGTRPDVAFVQIKCKTRAFSDFMCAYVHVCARAIPQMYENVHACVCAIICAFSWGFFAFHKTNELTACLATRVAGAPGRHIVADMSVRHSRWPGPLVTNTCRYVDLDNTKQQT